MIAQEMLLEDAAPMSSFQNKKLPEQWEQSASKLLDERWLEVFAYKVKSKDSYLESKKRLTASKGGSKGVGAKGAESSGDMASKKAAGKGKAKGGKTSEVKKPSAEGEADA